MTMNGGSVTTPYLFVGARSPADADIGKSGAGDLTINGGSLSVNTGITVGGLSNTRTGVMNVNGSAATISGSGAFTLPRWDTLNLNFDTNGVSPLDFGSINLGGAGGAGAINIDGSAYTGGSASFTLFNSANPISNLNLSAFSIAGVDSNRYATQLSYDSINYDVTRTVTSLAPIPEPAAVAALAGMAILGPSVMRRRRLRAFPRPDTPRPGRSRPGLLFSRDEAPIVLCRENPDTQRAVRLSGRDQPVGESLRSVSGSITPRRKRVTWPVLEETTMLMQSVATLTAAAAA